MARLRPWQIRLRDTPPDQRDRDIFLFPIFTYFTAGSRRHITGHVRTYLNELQIPRWNYFFRPNMKLINAVDKQQLSELTTRLANANAELKALEPLPRILQQLSRLRSRDALLARLAVSCGVGAILSLLALSLSWKFSVLLLLLLIGSVGFFAARPRDEIQRLEQAVQSASLYTTESVASIEHFETRWREAHDRIALLSNQIDAIVRFRDDIAAQRPKPSLNARDMDSFLNDALRRLEAREKERLNIYVDDEVKQLRPIVRWALETSRESALKNLRPPVNSIARRDNHYARYEVHIIFVHRGQLTVYEGFYDLILGEMMGETRRHIILANLFSVQDEIMQDFDFHRKLQDVIAETDREQGAELDFETGDDGRPDTTENSSEGEPNRVSITQTRIVRLVGSGDPLELKFIVSEERDTWIAQLQRDRQLEEREVADLEAEVQRAGDDEDSDSARELSAHEERLLRIREYEERVRRSETAQEVEQVVNQILEFTRQATVRPYAEAGPLGR